MCVTTSHFLQIIRNKDQRTTSKCGSGKQDNNTLPSLCQFLVRCFLLVALAAFPGLAGTTVAAELGETIANTAEVSWNNGGSDLSILTNEASFVVEAERTESTIEFFRHAPSLSNATREQVNGADYAPGGAGTGSFVPVLSSNALSNLPFDLSSTVPLAPASAYLTGEIMFVRVTDPGQNGNPNRIETVVVTVNVDTGDGITLRLYESGPDTGEFWAYIPSSRQTTPVNDPELTTATRSTLTATYIDSFDSTEVSVDTALVDPFGRVFNALTGELLDDIPVTLINSATGQPAEVFGVDGVSRYPSSITTGSQVTDAGGVVYDLEDGEFQFPLVAPGTYELQIETPDGFIISSNNDSAAFQGFPGAPFTIVPASFGGNFDVAGLGPVSFDVPLDPASDFVVSKTVDASIGDVGDFVQYTVEIENRGTRAAPITLRDIAPRGFRYVAGSSHIDRAGSTPRRIDDPQISEDGRTLNYDIDVVPTAATVAITYVMQIGASVGAGEAFNAAFVVGRNGEPLSNTARTPVTIREELFRTKSVIIGRVAEHACDADEDWARSLEDGTGIAGVRLYLETGVYAVTDEDGLYHFEDIDQGTHVVQVDKETLPVGYEPMVCEENSRYAGRATSKFIEVQGGNIWRANFYLKRTGDLAEALDFDDFNDQTEYKKFDRDWLAEQDTKPDWIYPNPSRTPSKPSINIGIKHGPDQIVTLSLNGEPVAKENFEGRDSDDRRRVLLSQWRGVDLRKGRNTFTAKVKDEDENLVETLTRDIWFVTEATRAAPVVDQSVLVADGRTTPVLAVRMEDDGGRPVHAGREMTVVVAPPYRAEAKRKIEDANELVAPRSAEADIVIGADGIARIRLEPTLKTGRVNLLVNLDDGRQVPIDMYLKPEKRDWILVGLAEGTVGYENLSGQGSGNDSDDVFTDGRVAFFAKGVIKGEWLLTLQVDSAKSRPGRNDGFETEIDPDAYYTLYGDRTFQEAETPSRYPLYAKLEKNQFYALFGDYDTNITEGKLTAYSRRLSGFKTEYVGGTFRVVAFGAESNQGFTRDEIAADGTSGTYRLDNAPILANSEKIEVETRDRFRPDRVIERTRLVRHLDYTLDNLTGELILRLPIPVSDEALNPNVIIVEYESGLDAERNFTYGARASSDLLDGRVIIGGTFVHQDGDDTAANSSRTIGGIDIVSRPAKGWEARIEVAQSRAKLDDVETDANGWLAEVSYRSEKWTADLYVRHEDEGFGIGSQSSATTGARRAGVTATYEFDHVVDEETGKITSRSVKLDAYHEENLADGSTRTLADVSVAQETDRYGVSVGLRHVKDDITGNRRTLESTLATISGRLSIPEWHTTISASHEQPLDGRGNVNEFPQRSTLSVSKVINHWATLNVSHEYRNSRSLESHITTAGVRLTPWTGGSVTLGSDLQTQDSSRRIGGTVGLDQQFKINENWSGSVGITHHAVAEGSGLLEQILPDAAVSPIELNEDYTSAYLGVGYRTDVTAGSGRIETRQTEQEDTYVASGSISREVSETFSVAGTARLQLTQLERLGASETDEVKGKLKLGLAWRPRVEGPVILNRLDLKFDRSRFGNETTKIVNNLAANAHIGDRTQVAGHYGVKFVDSEFGGIDVSGWTHLVGVEARFDVTERIDLGLHGSILYVPGSGTKEYAWGPSIGVSPADNIWMSLGYNFSGFADDDFEAARYTREGLYLKLRLKFDEDTARSILDMLSPYSE